MEFIKTVIADLEKRGINDLKGEEFYFWCQRNDFIPWRLREEIYDFKKTEEGQRFITQYGNN